MWQRKRRQYLCGKSPSDTPFFTDHDYTCRHADDDLRTSLCANKANQSVIDVLKNEIECGWSSAPTGSRANMCLLILTGLKIVQYLI